MEEHAFNEQQKELEWAKINYQARRLELDKSKELGYSVTKQNDTYDSVMYWQERIKDLEQLSSTEWGRTR